MLDPAEFDLHEIDKIIETYDYDADPVLQDLFTPIEEALWSCIVHYAEDVNGFGAQMADHLRRTSLDGMKFLVNELGFSEAAGLNFHAANMFQDLGKIHPSFDPDLWDLPDRPTEAQRAEKRLHIPRGPEVMDIALQNAHPDVREHPHVKYVIPALQYFHHERTDGSGPYGKTGDEMGQVIKTVCIVDAKDGDMIHRGHQNQVRKEPEALLRMKGLPQYDKKGKYVGAFDDMLDRYIHYREGVTSTPILSYVE